MDYNCEGFDMLLEERNSVYLARRIVRADKSGKTYKKLIKSASAFELKLVEALPELLDNNCIAVAEAIAVEMCGGSKNRFSK